MPPLRDLGASMTAAVTAVISAVRRCGLPCGLSCGLPCRRPSRPSSGGGGGCAGGGSPPGIDPSPLLLPADPPARPPPEPIEVITCPDVKVYALPVHAKDADGDAAFVDQYLATWPRDAEALAAATQVRARVLGEMRRARAEGRPRLLLAERDDHFEVLTQEELLEAVAEAGALTVALL